MFHTEAVDRRGVVVADFLLLGIEPYTLAYDGGLRTGGAPNGEGHFEADSQDALACFACAGAESMFACKLVRRGGAFVLRGHIAPHIWVGQQVQGNS